MNAFQKYSILIILVTGITSSVSSQIIFENKATELGISITGITSSVLGGVSFFDFDNDGWDDLTFASKSNNAVKFFKNDAGSFTEQFFNISILGHSKQVIWVDYDNDGDNDLFVTKVDGPNKLYQNDGSFVFTDVSSSAGFPSSTLYSYGASFGDFDNDGNLDVFICNKDDNYLIPNQLYKNNGNGTFTDVSLIAGISAVGHLSFCSAFFDYNNDGYQDIYISNDRFANKNILYENNGDGTFTDVSLASGADVAANAMSTTIDDYNNDGWLDIYITNTSEGNHLLRNNGDGTFTDVATSSGTIFNSIGWGANFLDADNDLDLDLYVSSMINNSSSGLLTTAFYKCQNNATYILSNESGFESDEYISFSNAQGDINNDGYPDFVVSNQAPDNHSVWRNTGGTNNWLKIKLNGVTNNIHGIGSMIEISVNNNQFYRYLLAGESFLGQNSTTEIFGVGGATNIDYVKVKWLNGIEDILYNVTPNQTLNITEGSALSLNEFEKKELKIFPNPSNGFFNIEHSNLGNIKIKVYNYLGKEIIDTNYDSNSTILDLSYLENGIYFLDVITSNQSIIKKVVIQ